MRYTYDRESHLKEQMMANAVAILAHWDVFHLVRFEKVMVDRVLFRNKFQDNPGKHGWGLLYDKFQFELTPDILRRYDFLLKDHQNWKGLTAHIGWQELAEPSAQIVVYVDDNQHVYELDFDRFSKVRDLQGIFGHFFLEYSWMKIKKAFGGRPYTDPFVIAQGLKKRGIYPCNIRNYA